MQGSAEMYEETVTNDKADPEGRPLAGIGTAGFEPATPATPLQCATGLRYVPSSEAEFYPTASPVGSPSVRGSGAASPGSCCRAGKAPVGGAGRAGSSG